MWTDYGFQQEITADGSPTLRLLNPTSGLDGKPPESMHHSGGAYAETVFIYGKLAQLIFDRLKSPKFLCVGLGLGYIEMQIAIECMKRPGQSIEMLLSFESEESLKRLFVSWLRGEKIPNQCYETYQVIAERTVTGSSVSIQQLKDFLLYLLSNKRWVLEGPLKDSKEVELKYGKFNGFFYDAFSSKTTASLWTEDFLAEFLKNLSEPDCALSTYACLGNLKRALKKEHFELIVRPGFLGKRNSTLGLRGLLKNSN